MSKTTVFIIMKSEEELPICVVDNLEDAMLQAENIALKVARDIDAETTSVPIVGNDARLKDCRGFVGQYDTPVGEENAQTPTVLRLYKCKKNPDGWLMRGSRQVDLLSEIYIVERELKMRTNVYLQTEEDDDDDVSGEYLSDDSDFDDEATLDDDDETYVE